MIRRYSNKMLILFANLEAVPASRSNARYMILSLTDARYDQVIMPLASEIVQVKFRCRLALKSVRLPSRRMYYSLRI